MKINPLDMFTIKKIFDFIQIPIFAIDKNREIFMWNKNIEEFTGINSKDALGKSSKELANKIYSKNNHFISEILFDKELLNNFNDFIIKNDNNYIKCVSKDDDHLIIKASGLYNKENILIGAVELIINESFKISENNNKQKIKNIYIVDDSKLSRNILKKIINKYEIDKIEEFENGNKLIARILKQKPDLIFMDLLMPGIKGDKIVKAIKENFPDIKIAVLTANIQKQVEDKLNSIGVDFYIKKPITEKKISEIFIRGNK